MNNAAILFFYDSDLFSLTTARGDRSCACPFPTAKKPAIVRRNVEAAAAVLDWPQVIETARPWVAAVRENPPPFWAMESLLKEYPISQTRGSRADAARRGAAAGA